ncbi:HD-GYP domain-containing protein (c-di-GMP phosphodiesterase class II) [Streptohalobacillus salinus]|uniref:HD-GYP domain-containing protein (C-di-GMP phosphodiesterase class II) n=1 Tax=Streptohalobacillus salinus TaxID=621096 RepID=A0A2V3WGP2_9BACI|nr:HD-GYP domain-containing protein [Streptohalobacillus salinus]PXW91405.1 HD-GYP domain-containing protein (c-di-GMP phosphodiesterase class II) [Streptohalobacillus salinus]
MRLIAARGLEEGHELAKPIYNDRGQILVQKDIKLTRAMVDRLLALGVTFVYIKDAISEDIIITSPVSEELKIESMRTVKSVFHSYKSAGFKEKAFLFDKTSENMAALVDSIIMQIQRDDEVLSIMSDIFISDDYLFSHSVNVTIYAVALANEMKLTRKQTRQLGLGAMLHDVGKVFLPEEILKKTGRLTDFEFDLVKTHPELGFEFLRSSSDLPLLVAHCAYQHHERIDGSGYPRGIEGKDMHLFGKILGVADVFDAVTSQRVYRDAMLPQEGLEILYSGSGTLFEPEMVRVFRDTIAVYPNGVTIALNDGRRAIVVRQNPKLYNRPVIRVVQENGQTVSPYDLDLAKELSITITGYKM